MPLVVHYTKYKMESLSLQAVWARECLKAARNYPITELEMCGLAINIASFAHLLKRVDFDAVVDHLVITH